HVDDPVDLQLGIIGATTIIRSVAWEVIGSTSQPLGSWLNTGTVAASTTAFIGPDEPASTSTTTENLEGVVIPYAATAKNLCIRTNTTQSANNSLVVTLRKNGTTSTALVITIAAGSIAAIYCDNTDTVSLAAGDWIDFQIVNNANVSSAQL